MFKEINMSEKNKKKIFLVLAVLPVLVLAMEFVIVFIESLFYGTIDFSTLGIFAALKHWFFTIIIWGLCVFFLYIFSKKNGFNPFDNNENPPVKNWIIVCILVLFSIFVSYISWDMRFKPIAEFKGFITRYNEQGVIAFIIQYLYYLVESILILSIIIYAQEFGERICKNKFIPWGGIAGTLTWGLGHILSKGVMVGILSFAVSIIFGIVYLLLRKNIHYAYFIIALMFIV
jgi:hypothetical protein